MPTGVASHSLEGTATRPCRVPSFTARPPRSLLAGACLRKTVGRRSVQTGSERGAEFGPDRVRQHRQQCCEEDEVGEASTGRRGRVGQRRLGLAGRRSPDKRGTAACPRGRSDGGEESSDAVHRRAEQLRRYDAGRPAPLDCIPGIPVERNRGPDVGEPPLYRNLFRGPDRRRSTSGGSGHPAFARGGGSGGDSWSTAHRATRGSGHFLARTPNGVGGGSRGRGRAWRRYLGRRCVA